jgi:hypothetical protein
MIHSQMEKVVASVPASVGSSAVTLTIDTLGFDYASISVQRASNASTVFASVLKVEQSDDNSTFVAVPGLTGGTDFAIPAVSNTAVEAIVKLDVDTKAKQRYLKVTATPAVSVNTVISGRLSRGEVAPASASEAGCIGWVKG